MIDYYKILEVDYFASNDDIKKAYRTLVKKYHPDKGMVNSDEKIKVINEAYRILSDDISKNEYDLKYRDFFNKQQNARSKNTSSSDSKSSDHTNNSDKSDQTEDQNPNDNNRAEQQDMKETIQSKIKISSKQKIIFCSVILIIVIAIFRKPVKQYLDEKDKERIEMELLKKINETKIYGTKSFPVLNSKINLKTRWADDKMFYIFRIDQESANLDSTARDLNRNKLYKLSTVNINFEDKDGFIIHSLEIKHDDFVSLKDLNNKLSGFIVNKSISFNKAIYSKIYDFSITYTGFEL